MIEFRQLLYLDAVYKYKNFTKASRALYVSQPTVSAAVQALEKELGLTLIERTPKSVVFTPAGEMLIVRIRRLLSDYNDILAEAGDLGRQANSTLRLGIAPILSSDIFPLIYKGFLPRHPELSIRLDEDNAHGHIRKLMAEELDLVFNGLPEEFDTRELRVIPVCRREIKIIMTADHPLAALEAIPVEKLRGENVSMLSSSGVMGQVLDKAISQHGLELNVISEHSQIHGMLEMALTGCSIGFVNMAPEAVTMTRYRDLILRPFAEPLTFMVGFMMKKQKYIPSVYKDFIAFISEAMGPGEKPET